MNVDRVADYLRSGLPSMLSPILFLAILVSICLYAISVGRSDERWVAATCLVASFGSLLLLSPTSARYSSVEGGVLMVDIVTLAIFVTVALRSDRYWPLWISGLQLTTTTAHLLKALDTNLMPVAYAAAGRFWGYPILLILAIGTYRSRVRAHHMMTS